MTDLEVVNLFVDTSLEHVHPHVFREIESRGLYNIINFLPNNKEEARAVAYARLGAANKVFGDKEIDDIAGHIDRLEILKKELAKTKATDVHKIKPILTQMMNLAEFVDNYFRKK